MVKRRDVLKLGLAAGGASLLASQKVLGQDQDLLKYLCPPDGLPPDLSKPSPKAESFRAELFVPPIAQPVERLVPAPDPASHQRYEEFPPRKFYEIYEREFLWQYHPDPPYDKGTISWGFWCANDRDMTQPMTPGPTWHARYGEPVLVRRWNNLPPVGKTQVTFALPSTTTHLHNAHTAAESDGYPMDYIDPGEFWDHHYGNFPSGGDSREKLTTLWYHDHRMDFTAANVYAGLSGFYLLFDEFDSGDERDPNPQAWHLPSGKYDVPLILHDVLFAQNGQVVFNSFNTSGILGDQVTINRRIRPRFTVERRKYRFRILNGGPSRFYQLFLRVGRNRTATHDMREHFTIITGDGNFQPEPVLAESIYLSVAQRVDVIMDFSQFKAGEQVYLLNLLDQTNGQGPSGRLLDPLDPQNEIMRFDVVEGNGTDSPPIPKKFRDLPPVDLTQVKFHRTWDFDYVGGLWTVNGMIFDPDRIDAAIEQGSAEIWTLRNMGNDWAHPIHSHFTEFIILEVNGKPLPQNSVQGKNEKFIEEFGNEQIDPAIKVFMGGPRRDVATLLPGDEMKVFMRWNDFLGTYVLHCHNVIHEDHAMMLRWDIVQPGKGFVGSRKASDDSGTHILLRPTSPAPEPQD